MNDTVRLIQVYKSPRREEMYLYVDKVRDLAELPESLMAQFGEPQEVMLLHLSVERKLARVDTATVLAEIDDKGYFLQLPPSPGDLLRRDGCS
jgi:uncharacterized protein YcgL (UPF0745 family)